MMNRPDGNGPTAHDAFIRDQQDAAESVRERLGRAEDTKERVLLLTSAEDRVGPQSVQMLIHASKDVAEQTAAQRLLADAEKPGAVNRALTILAATGALTASPPRTAGPKDLGPARPNPRRVSSVAEMREAARMAAEGIAMPGSKADVLLRQAREAGDFTEQRRLLEDLKKLAPRISAEADALEAAQKAATETKVADAKRNLDKIQRAKDKRARKAAQRANMQHGAREGGQ